MAKAVTTPFDEPPIQEEQPKKQRGQIVHDPELVAMQKIDRIIQSLPKEEAKIRVINWLKAKIEFPIDDR